MRAYIQIAEKLFEAAMTPDPYGYWIMPDGRIIPCAVQAHVDSAIEQLGADPSVLDDDPEGNENFNLRQEALAGGAVRISSGHNEVDVDFQDPTEEALKSAIRVLRLHKDVPVFFIDHERVEGYAKANRLLREYLG